MRARIDVLLAIAAGGAIGSLARYGVGLALPSDGGFPTATLLVNVIGCLLIGVLMATISEAGSPHRLLRPFLGVGIFGGFTTFSTYAVDVLRAGEPALAVLYATTTLALALAATVGGYLTTRAVLRQGEAT